MENGHDPTPVTVRDATIMDLPRLSLLYQHLCAAHPTPYPIIDGEEFPRFLQTLAKALTDRAPTLYIRVVDVDGTVVGFLAGEIMTRAIGRPHTYCAAHYLIIDPRYRHQGLARALIADGQQWLQAHYPDVETVELFSIAGDAQWERRGWSPFLVKYAMPVAVLHVPGQPSIPPVTEETPPWPA